MGFQYAPSAPVCCKSMMVPGLSCKRDYASQVTLQLTKQNQYLKDFE